jgi:hypothetical protein
MHEPYIAIYVHNEKLFFLKKLATEKKPREIFWVDIDEVISVEEEEISRKIGGTVLGLLRLWHPDVLSNFGSVLNNDSAEAQMPNDFDVAMHLISKSVSSCTKVYVQSIDTLLFEQSLRTKAAHDFLNESWPTLRAKLEKFK